MGRHSVKPRYLVNLELASFKELRLLRRYGNLPAVNSLLQDYNLAGVGCTTLNGLPAFAEFRWVFENTGVLEHSPGLAPLAKKDEPYSSQASVMPTTLHAIAMGK